ncbi:MAG: hypothetical protein AB7O67_23200 [Vicinamibacterales bacterium]
MQLQGFTKAAAVTPHDSNALAPGLTTKAIYVGGAGDLNVVINGATVLFKAVPVGTVLPIRPEIVKSSSTTATYILALGD